jgi:hypothetical protein
MRIVSALPTSSFMCYRDHTDRLIAVCPVPVTISYTYTVLFFVNCDNA